jgi:hypothetical protein
MRPMFRFALRTIVFFWSLPVFAQEDTARVSMNQVWNAFPDFVCKERIVSSVLENGKTKQQRIVESIFIAQRKTQTRAGSPVHSIVESRELTAIDRKPASKTAPMPTAPLFFDGLAANILFVADLPRYEVGQTEILEGRLTIHIGFSTQDAREYLQLEFPTSVSNVQIDAQSKKALHVDSRLGIRYGGSGVPVSADFQSIDIDGKAYWLPRLVKAEAKAAKDATLTYTAEYTECKKFAVSVQIRTVPAELQ